MTTALAPSEVNRLSQRARVTAGDPNRSTRTPGGTRIRRPMMGKTSSAKNAATAAAMTIEPIDGSVERGRGSAADRT